MKKLLFVLSITLLTLASCSTPQEREVVVEDYGKVIWRDQPTNYNSVEKFLVMDGDHSLWFIQVSNNGNISITAKIHGYKIYFENEF